MKWTARVELFGSKEKKVSSWVLVDPSGVIRARFYGLANNKEQAALAKRITELLTEVV